eukprot:2425023-Rhodomonas_salina.1
MLLLTTMSCIQLESISLLSSTRRICSRWWISACLSLGKASALPPAYVRPWLLGSNWISLGWWGSDVCLDYPGLWVWTQRMRQCSHQCCAGQAQPSFLGSRDWAS